MNSVEILPKDDGFQDYGLVCAANEARFSAANYSEPLTAFTVGWKDSEKIEDLLNFVAPVVPVARRFEFKVADNNEPFLSETDDIRSIGSAFKRVEFTGTSVTSKTYNKGLTIRVDHDDVAGDDWRERYVQLLLQRLYRNELRRAISALSGSAVSKNCVWGNTSGTPNPDADIRAELEAATNVTGIRPNRIILVKGHGACVPMLMISRIMRVLIALLGYPWRNLLEDCSSMKHVLWVLVTKMFPPKQPF